MNQHCSKNSATGTAARTMNRTASAAIENPQPPAVPSRRPRETTQHRNPDRPPLGASDGREHGGKICTRDRRRSHRPAHQPNPVSGTTLAAIGPDGRSGTVTDLDLRGSRPTVAFCATTTPRRTRRRCYSSTVRAGCDGLAELSLACCRPSPNGSVARSWNSRFRVSDDFRRPPDDRRPECRVAVPGWIWEWSMLTSSEIRWGVASASTSPSTTRPHRQAGHHRRDRHKYLLPGPSEGIRLLQEFTEDPTRQRLVDWLFQLDGLRPGIVTDQLIEERWALATDPETLESARRMYGKKRSLR